MNLDKVAAAAQLPIIEAAWDFLQSFYGRADLRGAWPRVHPTLRLCWVQWWLTANRGAIKAEGLALEEVAPLLAEPEPLHPLWEHFQRVLTRDLTAAVPLDVETASIGMAPRPMGVDLELLYVHAHAPSSGVWEAEADSEAAPLVMRLTDDEWQVMNLGYEAVPVPGWPPRLWSGSSR